MTYDNKFGKGPRRYSTCLLFSGGLDSLCAYRLLEAQGAEFDALYMPHDLGYSVVESKAVDKLRNQLGMYIRTGPLQRFAKYENETGWIPLRNQLLISAAVQEGYRNILIGALRGEATRDKSEKFFKGLSALISYQLGESVHIAAPFMYMTKKQLVKFAYEESYVTPADMRLTWSCYEPFVDMHWGGVDVWPCGECQACIRRWLALEPLGIRERYKISPRRLIQKRLRDPKYLLHELLKQPIERYPDILYNNVSALFSYLRIRYGRQKIQS